MTPGFLVHVAQVYRESETLARGRVGVGAGLAHGVRGAGDGGEVVLDDVAVALEGGHLLVDEDGGFLAVATWGLTRERRVWFKLHTHRWHVSRWVRAELGPEAVEQGAHDGDAEPVDVVVRHALRGGRGQSALKCRADLVRVNSADVHTPVDVVFVRSHRRGGVEGAGALRVCSSVEEDRQVAPCVVGGDVDGGFRQQDAVAEGLRQGAVHIAAEQDLTVVHADGDVQDRGDQVLVATA